MNKNEEEGTNLEKIVNSLISLGSYMGFFTGSLIFCIIIFFLIWGLEEEFILKIIAALLVLGFIIIFAWSIIKIRSLIKEGYKEFTQKYVKIGENG
ncbi:MAG: hypothetical protein GF311_19195 [Candidatus Lokiarchaeota archaeon]|nr:hypothetical protein [Candidatus Lokiarchaeota archaeon]